MPPIHFFGDKSSAYPVLPCKMPRAMFRGGERDEHYGVESFAFDIACRREKLLIRC